MHFAQQADCRRLCLCVGCCSGCKFTLHLVARHCECSKALSCRACRRDADFAWQLSVPIYHPTTTLVMVVYGEAGRGKITFLGKLHYRISYLMYLNHRSGGRGQQPGDWGPHWELT